MQQRTKLLLAAALTFIVFFYIPTIFPSFGEFLDGPQNKAHNGFAAAASALNGSPEKPWLAAFHVVRIVFASHGS